MYSAANQTYVLRKTTVFILSFLLSTTVYSQVSNTGVMDTTGGEHLNKITVGAYIDGYYGFNTAQPRTGNIAYFVNMNRHNEATINLAYIDVRFNDRRLRGRFVPGFGTYMNANYSAEQGLLKNIVEASAGVKIFDKKNIWIDFGILGSPYTNESAISRDHLMYTRSLGAENVPYYLAGAKVTAPLSKKIIGYLYLLNGWQQIQDQNTGKSIGTQLEYRPNNKNLINWNTYIGDESSLIHPDYRTRYFTDLYWIYNPDGKLSITSCAYIGIQEKKDTIKNTITGDVWWQANFTARVKVSSKVSLSGRVEYFNDPHQVMISPITNASGFNTSSAGLCLNVKLFEYAMYRIETRYFLSDKEIYQTDTGSSTNTNAWFISNLTLWF
ncbi:MAG: hypothetical protein JWO58_2512 [Chitinophagaceae bacterium]|nr:hypothetical protein [Chitinophagaceae bacterium]